MIRVLISGAKPGDLSVRAAAYHYLVRVHRISTGDSLEVFDGAGAAFLATVLSCGDETLSLRLGEPTLAPRVRAVTLIQGMPKADKLEWVVQKASELWATALQPAFCDRSVVKPSASDEKKTARWQKIADEAARQCGRSEVLKVLPAVPLASALAKASGQLLALDEEEEQLTLSAAVRGAGADAPLTLVVGPEGGLSAPERKLLTSSGAKAVTLGKLVLRTETAGLAALSVVRHLDGLLG